MEPVVAAFTDRERLTSLVLLCLSWSLSVPLYVCSLPFRLGWRITRGWVHMALSLVSLLLSTAAGLPWVGSFIAQLPLPLLGFHAILPDLTIHGDRNSGSTGGRGSSNKDLPSVPIDSKKTYDSYAGYVLLLDTYDPAQTIYFSPKVIQKILTASHRHVVVGQDAAVPTTTPVKKHHRKPTAGALLQSRLKEYLYYAVLDGKDGWLRFYTDSTCTQAKVPALWNIRDFRVQFHPDTLLAPRFFGKSTPLKVSSFGAPVPSAASSSPSTSLHFLWFPTGMEKEGWYIALQKATHRVDPAYLVSYQHHEANLLRQILESYQQSTRTSPTASSSFTLRRNVPTTAAIPDIAAILGDDKKEVKQRSGWFRRAKTSNETDSSATGQPSLSLPFHLLYSEETNAMDTRWLNLFLGCMWISMCDKEKLKVFFQERIMHKISRVKRPGFLGEMKVRNLDPGRSAPLLNNARIVSCSEFGDVHLEFDLFYQGGFQVEIETQASVDLAAVKSMTVDIVVAVVIEEIKGKLSVRMNPFPSSRIWWGFSQPPAIKTSVEPVVGDTNFGFNMVKEVFEKKLNSIIRDTLVYPNMEDLTLFGCDAPEVQWGVRPKTEPKATAAPRTVAAPTSPTSPKTTPTFASLFASPQLAFSGASSPPPTTTHSFGGGLMGLYSPMTINTKGLGGFSGSTLHGGYLASTPLSSLSSSAMSNNPSSPTPLIIPAVALDQKSLASSPNATTPTTPQTESSKKARKMRIISSPITPEMMRSSPGRFARLASQPHSFPSATAKMYSSMTNPFHEFYGGGSSTTDSVD